MLLWLSRLQFRKPLTKLSAESTGTLRSVANIFSFSVKKMLLSDCFSGYALTNCFDFVLKLFGLLNLKREEKYTKKKISQKKFPAKLFWGTVEGWFENSDETFGRNFKNFIPIAFFELIFSKKVSSYCPSRHVDCSLDHVFWIFDRKRLSISSQIFKHSRFLQKKRHT